jgi:hypothetical protein
MKLRYLYRTGPLTTVARDMARHKLNLMGLQGVKWDRAGTKPAGGCMFLYGSVN